MPGFFGGYEQVGPTDAEIGNLAMASRRATAANQQQAFSGGLRAMANESSLRGLGNSGAMAMGVPGLHQSIGMMGLEQEAALQRYIAALKAQQGRVWQQGPGGPLLGGLMRLGGDLGGAGILAGALGG